MGEVPAMHAISHGMPLDIAVSDIHLMGHVDNAPDLTWVQVAVLSRRRRFAPRGVIQARAWLSPRHEITYLRHTFLHDALAADVLLARIEEALASYLTAIPWSEDVFAEVRSSWCRLNAATRRPVALVRSTINYLLGSRRRCVADRDGERPRQGVLKP